MTRKSNDEFFQGYDETEKLNTSIKINSYSSGDSHSSNSEDRDKFTSLPGYQNKIHNKNDIINDEIKTTTPTKEHFESFDYDAYESRVNKQHDYDLTIDKYNMFQINRWTLTFFVGLCTAFIGIFIDKYTEFFMELKMYYFTKALDDKEFGNSNANENILSLWPFLVYAGINSLYIIMASSLVAFVSPPAKGSGISEIKATLNGIKIADLLSLKTLFVKAIGVLFSVAAGLPIGKEGPMIHSGAIAGAGISQGKSTNLGCDTSPKKFENFRNDKEKRDFISCGSAAGVAAAFGAPIGGVLFALEEGASFWHQSLTWRTFFCAMISAFTMNVYLSYANNTAPFGMLGTQGGTFSFGKFANVNTEYRVENIIFFIIMGVIGGLFGALSNHCNTIISKTRQKYIKSRFLKVIEAIIIGFVMSFIAYFTSYYFGTCLSREKNNMADNSPFQEELVTFNCISDEYNDLASLYFVPYSVSTKQLLHYTAQDSFTLQSLVLFFLPFYAMACWTYGITCPSGLFVPSLLCGAAYGRICLILLHLFGIYPAAPDGLFPLIGASAMLGGIARMTISLTVIILECTGVIEWGLPVMVTLMSARKVGNIFNEGIYDIHIHLRHIPFLEFDPPFVSKFLRVQNIMTKDPICIDHVVQVRAVYDALKSNRHYAYPVVMPLQDGSNSSSSGTIFTGVIFRKHLCTLLKRKDFFKIRPLPFKRKPYDSFDLDHSDCIPDEEHSLTYQDFNAQYPRWPNIDTIKLDADDMEKWMDLTPYMNPTPHTMQEMSPVTRAFRLFRSLGLRKLVILNRTNNVVGILTRKELVPKHIEVSLDSLDNENKSSALGYWHSFAARKSTRFSLFSPKNLED